MSTNSELLRAIQEDAVSTSVPVGELLRRCQILAARLRIPELAAWVQHELNGYPSDAELPEYRVLHGVAMGHFTGPFGSGIRNGILPANNLPEHLRHWAREVQFRQPIATLEDLMKKKEDGIRWAWPGDLVALVQQDFYENLVLAQAWLAISKSSIIGAVETVRNRILTFALEAEHLIEASHASLSQTPGTLSQVFHTVVYGNVGNLAQASTHVTQSTGLAAGDLEGLLRELRQLGLPDDDVADLHAAIEADGPPQKKAVGTRVASWIGGMVTRAMAGTWKVATTTATTVLPKLIAQYYGLPS